MRHLAQTGRPAETARVLVMGVTCQGSCRPARPCTIRSLRQAGALVDFYDPQMAETRCGGVRTRGLARVSPADLRRYDMVILERECDGTDYGRVNAEARWVLDARQANGGQIV